MPFNLDDFKAALDRTVDLSSDDFQGEGATKTVYECLQELRDSHTEDSPEAQFMNELLEAVDSLYAVGEDELDSDSTSEIKILLTDILQDSDPAKNYFEYVLDVTFPDDTERYDALLGFQNTVLDLLDDEARLAGGVTHRSTASNASSASTSTVSTASTASTVIGSHVERVRPLGLNIQERAVWVDTPRRSASGNYSPRDDDEPLSDRSHLSAVDGIDRLILNIIKLETPRLDEAATPRTPGTIGTFTPGFIRRLEKVDGKTTQSKTIANQQDFEALITEEVTKVNTMRALNEDINKPGANIGTIAKQYLDHKDGAKPKSSPLKYTDDVRADHKITTAALHANLHANVEGVDGLKTLKIKDESDNLLIEASFHKGNQEKKIPKKITIAVSSQEDRHLQKAVELALKACGARQKVVIDDPSSLDPTNLDPSKFERAMKVYLFAKAAGGGDKFELGDATKQAIYSETKRQLDGDEGVHPLNHLYATVSQPGSHMTPEEIRKELNVLAQDQRNGSHGLRPW